MIFQKDQKPKDIFLCNMLGPVVGKPIKGHPSLVLGARSNMTSVIELSTLGSMDLRR